MGQGAAKPNILPPPEKWRLMKKGNRWKERSLYVFLRRGLMLRARRPQQRTSKGKVIKKKLKAKITTQTALVWALFHNNCHNIYFMNNNINNNNTQASMTL